MAIFFLGDESIVVGVLGDADAAMTRKRRDELPDEVLVIAAVLGDIAAFDSLALRYRPAVVRVAQAIAGEELAEDVAQEALLTAFKALPSLEEPGKFAAWLHMITRHKALRFLQRERRLNQNRVALDLVLLERSTALRCPMLNGRSDRWAEVAEAIGRLPPEYALVMKLRYQDEMPLKRMAEFLALPLTTVKWRLHRGKQLLRTVLKERGGGYGERAGTRDTEAG